ncbi:unnamed protein product [Linum trigynum]|uniref:Expansin n=2 Tax=Linum trigynum TaxID=586398 RepID=A0AAV2CPE6_9ROSI
MASLFSLLLCSVMALVGSSLLRLSVADGKLVRTMDSDWSSWQDAHATFYGDKSGKDTMQGACGYGDLFKQGYGLQTAALSTALFKNGLTCGACYELKCVDDPNWKFCYRGVAPIQITATNFCPPNPAGGACNPPMKHFDLSMPMFLKMAPYKAGIVRVQYRRVTCAKQGGVKFEIKGNPNWILVLPYNVGGAGDVKNVRVLGSKGGGWIQMQRNWGQNWQTGVELVGQSLSFQVVTSDGAYRVFRNVVPANWQFGQTFDSNINF